MLQIRPRLLGAPRLAEQVRLALAVLTRIPARQGPGLGEGLRGVLSVSLETLEKVDDGLGCEVLVVVVVDLNHGGVDAGTQALDLDEGEESVLGGLALLDAEVLLDSFYDDV